MTWFNPHLLKDHFTTQSTKPRGKKKEQAQPEHWQPRRWPPPD